MEQFWQEFVRAESGGQSWSSEPLAAQRRAFFFGAWSQSVFQQKLSGLDPATAARARRTLELELAREVSRTAAIEETQRFPPVRAMNRPDAGSTPDRMECPHDFKSRLETMNRALERGASLREMALLHPAEQCSALRFKERAAA